MGAKFIDELLNELHAKRQRQFNDDAAQIQQRQTAFAAREIWFAGFCGADRATARGTRRRQPGDTSTSRVEREGVLADVEAQLNKIKFIEP